MRRLTQVCGFTVVEWGELDHADQQLLKLAIATRDRARAPQSHFRVGAAIEADSGHVFVGCNCEDMAFNGTIHAEACALGAMVAALPEARCARVAFALGPETTAISCPPKRQGPDITEVGQIAYTMCGHCRTMMAQYGLPQGATKVLALQANGQIVVTTVAALYPAGFAF